MKNYNREPLVTIGIPFYNPGYFIIDAIRSVFAQTYNNWELFLIDDGSTDGIIDIISKIKDPRVHILSDGKNKGLIERLNQIIQISSGEYIARMDADDIMHPERIAKQVAFLESNPNIDVIDTGAIILNKQGLPIGVKGLEEEPFSIVKIFKWGTFLHASIMGKRDWFRNNLYDINYHRAEDRELFIRTLTFSNFAHIPEPLYFYRFEGNVRLKAYLQSYKSERKVLLKYGPKMIGLNYTIYLYARSLLKSFVLVFLSLLNKENLINKNKYQPLCEIIHNNIKEILEKIHNTEIPGINE
ncbi:glycosyltransferase family 2 protein [Thermovenabulum gondwanense]|uniref:Putative glycosyltransferase EpsE n=1 Tax=Thermovenabulum gondwanense TaxID=520767 RepID=A0A161QCF0_9FIRM|nr:glycosyltransferase family 2 protein [Thermovenabulum gondwanense]KYO66928.1 putative glycosyltransferase EpsE [Thermovenabulum gondwanense]